MKSQTDISHYCHANPARLMDLNGMFDTEDEVMWFSFHNDINGPTIQRQNGSYELYDQNTRFTYYHDADGVLHTDIPEVKVECQRISKHKDPNVFETVTHTLATSDDIFNDVARPVIQGFVLCNPILGTFNSGYTIIMGKDIYGNEADVIDYTFSIVDFATLGVGRMCIQKELIKSVLQRVNSASSKGTILKTILTELGRNDE